MTRMTGPDCVVMCNLINTYIHTYIHAYIHIHTYIQRAGAAGAAVSMMLQLNNVDLLHRSSYKHLYPFYDNIIII